MSLPQGQPVPLTTLLSWVWIAHTIETDNGFEHVSSERVGRHFRISLPMWTNGLRFIDEDGVTVDELRTRARSSCNLGGLERWGWISIGEPGAQRRDGYGSHRGVNSDSVLRPTRAGTYARRAWPRVVQGVEERWRTRFGGDVVDAVRNALLALATPLPWSPPEVSPANGFYTKVVNGDGIEGDRPLAVLLGQVLTALTLAHEQEAKVSLPLGANVLRAVGSESVRLRDLPAMTGISKEGLAMATGYLERNGFAHTEPGRIIALTAAGLDALDGYWHYATRPEHPELRATLTAIVTHAALSEGLAPPEGCWRGERPYLAQTQRLLANPTGALPWHPMVLHRGAWPDAS